jgi:hypothetical protein
MSMMRTSPVITVTAGGSGAPPSRPETLPATMTLASLQMRLNAALRQTGPTGGGGRLGGPGRLGAPGGAQAQAQAQQQPIMPAGNVKTMGQLPQVFTGDHSKVDNFIEEVKGYLCLNQDVAGFNSPIKKIAFTLMLIKGTDTAR